MARNTVFSILVLILAACTAARTEVPTQHVNLEEMEPAVAMTYLAEDIDIGDGGLLSDKPCAVPCVFGVRIGETTLEEIIPILENNGISRCWVMPSVSWTEISCGNSRFHVSFVHDSDLVVKIAFDPNVSIHVGDVIKKHGEPDYITADYQPEIVNINLEPILYVKLNLYWNSLKMMAVLKDGVGEAYEISYKTPIEIVQFSDEEGYRLADKETQPYYQPWHGYGTYQPTEPFIFNVTAAPTATADFTPIP